MDEKLRLLELAACVPTPVDLDRFNPNVVLPYGLTVEHIRLAMSDFINFLGFINQELNSKSIERLESMLMQANFSSMVGEFMGSTIPKYCPTIVKNQYHNGHPDLIPADTYPDDAIRYAPEGIEIKGSRRTSGWQGHNPEDAWLMVFIFDSNAPPHAKKNIPPRPFSFVRVVGAKITKDDWKFSGRKEGSRRTITASITKSGRKKCWRIGFTSRSFGKQKLGLRRINLDCREFRNGPSAHLVIVGESLDAYGLEAHGLSRGDGRA